MEELISEHGRDMVAVFIGMVFIMMTLLIVGALFDIQMTELERLI